MRAAQWTNVPICVTFYVLSVQTRSWSNGGHQIKLTKKICSCVQCFIPFDLDGRPLPQATGDKRLARVDKIGRVAQVCGEQATGFTR